MKMTVEVELNWLGEDGDIDAAIRDSIAEKCLERIPEKAKENLQKYVDSQFKHKIDGLINEVLSGFMDRNIVVTDQWGDEVSRYESVREMLKEKFNTFMSEKVDTNGKAVDLKNCGYNSKPRVEYMISKIVPSTQDMTDSIIKKALTSLNEVMKQSTEKAQAAIVANLVSKVDFEAGIAAKLSK